VKTKKIEVLAPAGNPAALKAAVFAGADAVYMGGSLFSARASAVNFSREEMREAVLFARERNVRVYVTVNTLLKDDELPEALDFCKFLCSVPVDGILIQDMGLFNILREACPEMPLHASTQMSLHTPGGAALLKELGASRVVLAREMSLKEIEEVSKKTDVELEAFVHGALCMSLSGQCYFSAMLGGRSGNHWVGLLSAGYFLPQIITILGSIFYEAWQLSAVTEETDREAFFSKIFRVYASVLFCCVAGIIMLCQLLMRVFKAEYFDAWTFVPFLTLCSMLTCMNQFLNSIYVVYKRSTGSLVTMLAGAVLNLILNYCFIRLWGPWGVTLASFLSLMLVFLLRAYSTRGLLEIDFHPAWLILNLALVLAEIWCMMNLTHGALPVVGITAVVCVMNIREVLSMLDTLLAKFVKKKK